MSTKSKNIFLGKNIAPYPIEDRIKSELADFVSNCVVVSDTSTNTNTNSGWDADVNWNVLKMKVDQMLIEMIRMVVSMVINDLPRMNGDIDGYAPGGRQAKAKVMIVLMELF